MNYLLRDNKTNKNQTYYYSIIHNKCCAVTDKTKAYIFTKIEAARNALMNNIPKNMLSKYLFEIVSYDDVFSPPPISKSGKINYSTSLNIPDPPVLKKNIGDIVIQIKGKKETTVEQPSEYTIENKNVYNDLQQMISTIQDNIKNVKDYKTTISNELSYCDKEIIDIQHFIEFNQLSASQGYKIYKDLHIVLQKRRELKNLLYIIEEFNSNSIMVQRFLLYDKLKDYNTKFKYKPRTSDFEHLFNT